MKFEYSIEGTIEVDPQEYDTDVAGFDPSDLIGQSLLDDIKSIVENDITTGAAVVDIRHIETADT